MSGFDIDGLSMASQKHSAVSSDGNLRQGLLDGMQFRPVRPVPHEDGHLIELARQSWHEIDRPIVQVHVTSTMAGRVRAWGLHQRSTDRLSVVTGLLSIVCFDGRTTSPTYRRVVELKLSPQSPGLLVIPPNVYHGWKNIGVDEANIVNMPTEMYAYDHPDALDVPYESDEARALVPWRW